MSKYSEEYKLRVVKAYISGEGGTKTVAKKYKVARTCLQQWVAQYELTGSFTKPIRHFSGEFKLKVLNY
ncbi:MAG: transposase, partial [Spirochaetaceae bacterium]|nr:transposase [Spirochaetaceae bacterium]